MKDIKWTEGEKRECIKCADKRGMSCYQISKNTICRTPSAIKSMLERHGYTAIMGEPE
jgi:hypothetical protein